MLVDGEEKMENHVCMVIDIDRCWGCRACEIACKQELELGVGPRPMQVIDIGPRKFDDRLHKESIPTMCLHCDQADCMDACPTGAIYRAADGTVQIDAANCNACAACQAACPFGAVEDLTAEGKFVKCTLCFSRREAGGIPSCAQHCVGRAFTMATKAELEKVIGGRYSWTRGRVVYVSSKWMSLGKALEGDEQARVVR